MRRYVLTFCAVFLTAVPSAWATDFTIQNGGGACNAPADLVCGTLEDASNEMQAGDSLSVPPGSYAGAEFSQAGITIKGATGVVISGPLSFTASGGDQSKLQRVLIIRSAGTGPALLVDGPAGLELSDSVVLGFTGNGATFSSGTNSKVVRSTLATAQPLSSPVAVSNGSSTPNAGFTIESSVLAGGASGLAATTSGGALDGAPGDITVNARHITAAGSTVGISADSSNAVRLLDPGAGNIAVNVTDSIVLKGAPTAHYDGLLGGDNTATISFTRSLLSGDPATLFVNPGKLDYHLRPGTAPINQGGFTAGESATDLDGNARPGPVTDIGADEFVANSTGRVIDPALLSDKTGPDISISKPKSGQRIREYKRGKKLKSGKRRRGKRARIEFAGRATDANGISEVKLALRATKRVGGRCRWFSPARKTSTVVRSCNSPVLFNARNRNGTWKYTVAGRHKFSLGGWQLSAFALDVAQNRGATKQVSFRFR